MLVSHIKGRVDFAIITIKEEELAAVLRFIQGEPVVDGERHYQVATVKSTSGKPHLVAVTRCDMQGNTEAYAAARDIIEELRPRCLLVVGIGGAVPAYEYTLGDVILANRVNDTSVHSQGHQTAPTFSMGGGQLERPIVRYLSMLSTRATELGPWNTAGTLGMTIPNVDLTSRSSYYGTRNWKLDVKKKLLANFGPTILSRMPLFRVGPINSSDILIKDDATLASMLSATRDVLAVDMESAGAYKAAIALGVYFMAIRGLSDIIGFKRDPAWTEYACRTAASLAIAIIASETLPIPKRAMIHENVTEPPASSRTAHHDHTTELRSHIEQMINPARGSQAFTLKLAFAPTFAELEQEIYSERSVDTERLLAHGEWRKVLIHAPGGHGKTGAICRLIAQAIDRSIPAFLLDATRGIDEKDGSGLTVEDLVNQLSPAGNFADLFHALETSEQVLLVFDGLNEVALSTSETIVRILDRFATEHAKLTLVITDRMNPHPGILMMRGTVLPLDEEDVESCLATAGVSMPDRIADRQLLSIPFFLELQLRLWADGAETQVLARREMLEKYFNTFLKINIQDWDILEKVAFTWYAEFACRAATVSWIKTQIPLDLADRLFAAGVCVRLSSNYGEQATFSHQLLHDFLVGRYIASLSELEWTSEVFDIATFQTNSFEPISFAAELLEDKANRFLIVAYDWNYWAVCHSVSDLRRSLTCSPVSQDLVFAMDAKNGEKRFELFTEAIEGAVRRLETSGTDAAKQFLAAAAIEDIVALVHRYSPTIRLFSDWKDMFTLEGGTVISDDKLLAIKGDPIVGWTAANVYRRINLNQSQLAQLRTLFRFTQSEPDTFPWRIVHILGAYPLEENAELLQEAYTGKASDWVRYGAFRSLMEVAVRGNAELRARIFLNLRNNVWVFGTPLLLQALRRTALVNDPPIGWYHEVLETMRAVPEILDESLNSQWHVTLDKVIANVTAENHE